MSLKYTIKSGDTLSQIAQSMGVNMTELAKANGIEDANKIRAGRKLSMPSPPREAEKVRAVQEQMLRSQNQEVKKEAVIQEKKYALPQQTKRDERRDAAVGYTVKPGDTFNSVAKARGVSVDRFRALNPEVIDPNKISVGQNLRYQEEEVGFKDKITSFFTGDDEATEKSSLLEGSSPEPETVSKQGSSFSVIPENAKAFGKFLAGNLLGLGEKGGDIDVSDFGKEQKKVLRVAMENASKDGRDYIKYSDYLFYYGNGICYILIIQLINVNIWNCSDRGLLLELKMSNIKKYKLSLQKLNTVIDLEISRSILESELLNKKTNLNLSDRFFDKMLIFKIIILLRCFIISHDQTEF